MGVTNLLFPRESSAAERSPFIHMLQKAWSPLCHTLHLILLYILSLHPPHPNASTDPSLQQLLPDSCHLLTPPSASIPHSRCPILNTELQERPLHSLAHSVIPQIFVSAYCEMGFPDDSVGSAAREMLEVQVCPGGQGRSLEDPGRSPRGGQRNPLQYPCLGNPMDRGMVSYSSWSLQESDMTKHASTPCVRHGFQ